MTKIYRTEEVPAKTREVCIGRECDLCHRKAESGPEWSSGSYVVNETEVSVTVKHRSGENYPEGGWGSEWEIDICPDCFKNRLLVWLRDQGAQVVEREWDW